MYNYQIQRENIFTEKGQVMFLKIRDNVDHLLSEAGAVRMVEAISACEKGECWDMLACVDRMVELEEIGEITNDSVCSQYRVFVRRGRR